mmetsp:Transcript_26522/g.63274  ORF Transcript_26522/g.63274 Transcript_26522/m.63274 type:complete len:81 (-) Transcript_26522:43-285(-)
MLLFEFRAIHSSSPAHSQQHGPAARNRSSQSGNVDERAGLTSSDKPIFFHQHQQSQFPVRRDCPDSCMGYFRPASYDTKW